MVNSEILNQKSNMSIPEDWEISLLDDLAIRGSGHTPDKAFEEYYNGGIKWVSLADSHRLDNGLIYETEIEISDFGIKKSSAVLHPAGAVIISRDAGVGKSAILGSDMAVSQHFIVWKCKESILDNWFLYYWLQLKKEYFERQAVGSTIKTLGLPLFKKLKIIHPKYNEQLAIANVLASMDTAINTNYQIIAQKELRKKWLMQNLLTGQMRLKGFEGEWKEYKMKELFKHLRGQLLSKDKLDQNGDKKCILYGELFTKYKEIISNVFSKTNSSEGTPSIFGDILMPGSTTTTGIDLAVTSTILENGVLLGGDINIFRKLNDLTYPQFMSYFLTNTQKRNILPMTQGVTIVHIYGGNLMELNFKIPDLDEQVRITQILESIDNEIQLLKDKTEKLMEQKKWMMQVLLTGKKRLKIN